MRFFRNLVLATAVLTISVSCTSKESAEPSHGLVTIQAVDLMPTKPIISLFISDQPHPVDEAALQVNVIITPEKLTRIFRATDRLSCSPSPVKGAVPMGSLDIGMSSGDQQKNCRLPPKEGCNYMAEVSEILSTAYDPKADHFTRVALDELRHNLGCPPTPLWKVWTEKFTG